MSVTRADKLLADRQLVASRTQAQRLIAEGKVRYRVPQGANSDSWVTIAKASDKIPDAAVVDVLFDANDRFVSRGGIKLAHALSSQQIDVTGCIALDVGQSTGGFTDCLLQHGCNKVVGVDVGHDQLDARLRDDARVICLEGINARELDAATLRGLCVESADGFDIIVMDVSFISQTKILPQLKPLLKPHGWLVTLVKPQFELSRPQLGKGGIVRDEALYKEVRHSVLAAAARSGFVLSAWLDSPIAGGDGNHEFLLVARHLPAIS